MNPHFTTTRLTRRDEIRPPVVMIDERVVGLRYVARGIGGVEEMRASLDDSKVCFGLLRFVFGRGTFARVKTLMVHWNGSKCPVVRRGRANASKPLVEVRYR